MSDCFATLLGLNPEGWKSEPAASAVTGTGPGAVQACGPARRPAVALRALMSPDGCKPLPHPLCPRKHVCWEPHMNKSRKGQ